MIVRLAGVNFASCWPELDNTCASSTCQERCGCWQNRDTRGMRAVMSDLSRSFRGNFRACLRGDPGVAMQVEIVVWNAEANCSMHRTGIT